MTRVPKPEALTAQEAAVLLNAHVETIRRLARQGEIPSFKLGKDWRFHEAALRSWADAASRTPSSSPRGPQATAHQVDDLLAAADRSTDDSFPIVGIGASAGGLEALEQFFQHVPDKSGLAFVVVQHLDPTHKGMLVELLQRVTAMKVLQIRDRLRVKPDTVHVIPPNKDLSILHGVLHLLDADGAARTASADRFLLPVAGRRPDERALGVVLSGMGSDGTLGLADIKAHGGTVFVQELASAKFDSMPRSAIDAGLADVVAPAEELAEKVVAYQRSPLRIRLVRPRVGLQDSQRDRKSLSSCCGVRPVTTSLSTSGAPSTAASSAAWVCTRSTGSPAT